MRDQTSLKAVQYFQVNFISTGSRLSPAQFSLDSEKSALKHRSSIHPSTGSLTFFTHAQEPTHPIVYSLIYLITHSLAYPYLLICSFTCTLNCSLISLMILITPCLHTVIVTHICSHSLSLTLTLPGLSAGMSGSLDSYCSLKPLCLGMGEVVLARTSPTLLPPSPRTVLSLSCFKVSQCINCRDWHCKS